MCNNHEHRGNECAIVEILRVIEILQNNACPEACSDLCDRPVLGGGNNFVTCNTRPVQLFLSGANGTPLCMPIYKDAIDFDANAGEGDPMYHRTSSVFRVEKLEGDCCTFRVLEPRYPQNGGENHFVATNSCFTLCLDCCCCIRCLTDCYVECI